MPLRKQPRPSATTANSSSSQAKVTTSNSVAAASAATTVNPSAAAGKAESTNTSKQSTSVPKIDYWPKTFSDGLPLPKLVVFDLDYTLWPFWVDTHVTSPLKATEGGLKVNDRYGEGYGFYPDVGNVLEAFRTKGIKISLASRTHTADLAKQMLKLLRIPPSSSQASPPLKNALEYFSHVQIFPGNKTQHFQNIRKATGTQFEDMLFFDDEARNRNVESLGVTMWLVRDGVSRDEVDRAIRDWRKRTGLVANTPPPASPVSEEDTKTQRRRSSALSINTSKRISRSFPFISPTTIVHDENDLKTPEEEKNEWERMIKF